MLFLMISPMAMISLRDDIHTASVAQLWMIRIVRLKRRVKLNQYEKHGKAVLFLNRVNYTFKCNT